ncbi:ABC-F family ATP-binding cassette domain-containing protein [Erysipelotrichaceae bacterium OttesenSCG-928-M19]|nr:ABC-F family ATP-binding cassette domain-containing protein [Erysipelotrichaceae bacterium OttesenSCG-928-M19]
MSLKNIFVEYNDKIILDNIDFNIQATAKIGLIGLNGSGKSTLLKIINNYHELSNEQCMVKNNIRIAYLAQETTNFETDNILDYVSASDADLFEAKSILNKLELDDYDKKITALSGGQKKRLMLAKVLVNKVDLLLLDEPTNHLDANMIEWLEDYLKKINCAIVMISHDRYFLERIVTKIIELDKGKLFEYEGNYQVYLELKAQRLESQKASHRKQIALLRDEKKWIIQGPKARSTKNKDRITRYEKLKESVVVEKEAELTIDSRQSRLGKKILELNNLQIGYENNILINDFSYIFKHDDRIGLVGVNGSGKSSFLNVLAQQLTPLAGNLDYGTTVKIGYFSQFSDDLDSSKRVIDYIKDKAEYIQTKDGQVSASAFLEEFLFDASQQYSLIEKLSGGERRRLLLVGVLMKAPNFLILDEPTNDLDITTLTILEDYLLNFNGVIVLVSHDRYFMDKVINSLWIINNKQISFSFDDYTSYLKNSKTNSSKQKDSKKEYVKEKKLRLSYQEQKDLAVIDDEIEKLQQELLVITQEMTKAGDDYQKIIELQQRQNEVSELLDNKTERWLELHEKIEKIANNN